MTKLLLGPVLSFRGISDADTWKVSALMGIKDNDAYPEVLVDGKRVPAPAVLLRHKGIIYLRYNLSCDQRKVERRVEYSVSGIAQTWSFTVPGKDFAPRMAYVSCLLVPSFFPVRFMLAGVP